MSKLVPAVTMFAVLVGVAFSQSSKLKMIVPEGAKPSPNYSQGIQFENTLYVSGTTGNDPKTQKVPDNFEAEVQQCLDNIGAVLHAGGMDYSNVVAVQVYMTDLDLFQRMNAVYTKTFKEPRPTRTTVGISRLAGAGAHVEITVTARK